LDSTITLQHDDSSDYNSYIIIWSNSISKRFWAKSKGPTLRPGEFSSDHLKLQLGI